MLLVGVSQHLIVLCCGVFILLRNRRSLRLHRWLHRWHRGSHRQRLSARYVHVEHVVSEDCRYVFAWWHGVYERDNALRRVMASCINSLLNDDLSLAALALRVTERPRPLYLQKPPATRIAQNTDERQRMGSGLHTNPVTTPTPVKCQTSS